MRCVLQRVSEASVEVDGQVVGAIGPGLLVLLGVAPADDGRVAAWLAEKIVRLRIFGDEAGRFDRSVADIGGEVLVVPQFTLFADARKGTRPSFAAAAAPAHAQPLYERFCELVEERGVPVQRGIFGASMRVSLINEGPVTFQLERSP